jgi:transposase-like protein
VCHRAAVGAVAHRVGDQAPPVALLAQTPAAQPPLDDLVHLQAGRVIAAAAVRLTRKQRGEVDEHRDGRLDRPERLWHGLAAVVDRLQISHSSIIRTAYLLKWTYAGQVTFADVGPVGVVDYPRTYQEFRAWFPDDASCAEYLTRLRWPEGFRCPVCGGDRAWQTSTQHWKCVECGRKTSVTAGTIFHRTRTPLSTWFAAIWLVTSQKNGASAQNLHDMLGLGSYETAWAWLHKLRRAMVRPDRELLSGVVEVDEAFVGGRATGRQGASTDKVPVMIAVENVGTQVNRKLRLGRVRLGVADAPGSKQLVEFARSTVAPGSLIRTDGARMFRVLDQEGYTHQYVSGYSSPEPGHVTLPGPHRVASLLKRWNAGTHHYRVEREHLQYYLDEFTFRFNRRRSRARGLLFYRLLQQSVNTDPHPLADLIGGTAVNLRDKEVDEEFTLEPLPSNTFGEF